MIHVIRKLLSGPWGKWLYPSARNAYAFIVRLLARKTTIAYRRWILHHEGKEPPAELSVTPSISVLVPVYNASSKLLEQCIQSVLRQTYTHWQLCLADDYSSPPCVERTLNKYADDSRIRLVRRKENGGISFATNDALAMADGTWVVLLDCDDVLAPNALYEVARVISDHPDTDMIYSDEDLLSENGKRRFHPLFKPDWAPDTLLSYMYISHLTAYRTGLVRQVGGMRSEFDGAQDYDLALRIAELTRHIRHIPKVLYHWRQRKVSAARNADAKHHALAAAQRAKKDALKRRSIQAHVEYVAELYQSRVIYQGDETPLVSVIIPSKDHPNLIEACLTSLRVTAGYPNYEVIVVDNGSNNKNRSVYALLAEKLNYEYLYQPMPFNFARMCNLGAHKAKGDILLFLNDDVIGKGEGWMSRMAHHCLQKHTGAVGAKLFADDEKTLQHIGIVLLATGPSHWYYGQPDVVEIMHFANTLENNYIAVTGACMMLERRKFDEVGGFDESFAINYNDVELCMRLYERGYFNVLRADAVLVHAESVSRGKPALSEEKLASLMQEQERLYQMHEAFRYHDPFHNPNLRNDTVIYEISSK